MPGTVLMGRVDQVLHKEGDRVKSGALLARIESREVNARLAQAEANVAAAQAMEENARRMKERMERLSEKQAATRKNLEDATAGYEAAAANLQAAEEGVKAARMYVAYSSITAPFDGTIVEKRVEAGDTAAPGMPLFTIEDSSKVKIEASVPESLAPGLVPGSAVEVEIEAAGGGRRAATIAEVLPDADPRSRTVIVRIVLDNADGAIRSGSFARVRIPTGQNPATGGSAGRAAATSGPPPAIGATGSLPTAAPSSPPPASAGTGAALTTGPSATAAPSPAVLFVPDSALVHQGPLAGLFVVDGSGVARLRWVTAGRSAGGATEILTGLLPGEKFVVEPPAGLADGRRVESR